MTIRGRRSALPLTSVFLLYALPVLSLFALSLSNGSKACLSLCPMLYASLRLACSERVEGPDFPSRSSRRLTQ